MSEGALVGFTLMEIGIILILVAQSFNAQLYRFIVFWGGVVFLLCGISLFFAIKERPRQ